MTDKLNAIEGITESENKNRRIEDKFKRILEELKDEYFFYSHGTDGVFTYLSPSITNVLGYSPDEFMTNYSKYLTKSSVNEDVINKTNLSIQGIKQPPYEVEIYHKEGSVKFLEVREIPVFDKKGNVIAVEGIAYDITDRKKTAAEHTKLEEQYRQSQKMEAIGRLSGGIAHDFNNLLSIILGFSQLALKKVDRLDPLYQDISEIITAGRRSVDLISQLLAFSRKQKVVSKIINLNEIISKSEKILRMLIGEDIEFKFIKGSDLWTVNIDPSQIDQIITNLAVNSRDAIEGVGKIVVETSNIVLDQNFCTTHSVITPGEYVMISFSDNGCGMDTQTMDKIFEPFFTTKGKKGTGFGLSTVYGIVTQNNGFIDVYSEPGRGTTFKIYIPNCKNIPEVSSNIIIDKSFKGKETILLVEDEESLLHLCKRILEGNSYNVITAGSPVEAIALVEKNKGKIDLLITDVIMPEMNGKELSKRIKTMMPDIRILFMSGYTDDVIGNLNLSDEKLWFIPKPFLPDNFLRKVRKVLDN